MNLIAKMTKSKVLYIVGGIAAVTAWLKMALDKMERNHNEMWE